MSASGKFQITEMSIADLMRQGWPLLLHSVMYFTNSMLEGMGGKKESKHAKNETYMQQERKLPTHTLYCYSHTSKK